MVEQKKALILGAGPCGLSLALRLHQTTFIKPVIYELRPAPSTLGGAIGVPGNGLRLFDRLGVYESLLERGSSQSDFAMYSLTASGTGTAGKDVGVLGQVDDFAKKTRESTGYGYMRIKRTDIVDILLRAVREAGIEVHFGKRLLSIQETDDDVCVSFDDESTADANMLFGCDGIHSAVRSLYVDPDQKPEYSGLAGLFSTISTGTIAPGLVEGSGLEGLTVTMTGNGTFLAAPCTAAGDEIYWGFQRETPLPSPDGEDSRDGWEIHGREEVAQFKENLHSVLSNASGNWPDFLRALVDQTEIMKFYPIYRLPLGRKWFRGRCLLLGDAAHAMQPHVGQGVSMAVEDVFLISRLLAKPNQNGSMEDTFEAFCLLRRSRIEEIYQRAAGNAGVRRKSGPWGRWVKESLIWVSFLLPDVLGIVDRFFGQKYTVYDVDEEEI